MGDGRENKIIKFDAYIKKSLKNETKYRTRSRKNHAKRYICFSDLSKSETEFINNELSICDTYSCDIFKKVIQTSSFDAVVHDELLYEALKKLNPSICELLLLKFWKDLTDREVGRLLNMSQQMVNYNKNKALKNLEKIIEEMRQNDKRFKL